MNYKLGEPKDLDSITLEDVLEHKIWIWTWEAGLEGEYNEDWQVPVKGIDNITNQFTEPIITLKVVGADLIASGAYNFDEKKLFGISIWENGKWQLLTDISVDEPIIFESMIKINGKEKIEFVLNSKEIDEAWIKK
tara:strand:+ start:156 stop:563 length:408 start_codon:yes stop_codon:yes gene_type:complete